jgi:hypothetical protein
MATTRNTNKKIEENIEEIATKKATAVSNEESVKDEKIKALELELAKLTGMMTAFMNNNNNNQPVQVINPVMKMDQPCTLIHLTDCPQGLPNTIKVNNVVYSFSRFGETHTFRFSEMQNILSTYNRTPQESWFERGIFALGDDCDELFEGVTALPNKIPVALYKKIETLNITEFEKIVKELNEVQRVNLSQTWIRRYLDKKPGYNNIDKIRILNNYTKTSEKKLKSLINQINDDKTKAYILNEKQVFKKGIADDLLNEIISSDENDD